jgi:hypothetical protein
MSHPWERSEGETSKAFAAFCTYRDLGIQRSHEKVREQSGRSPGYERVIRRWSSRYQWEARTLAYDDHMDAVRRSGREKAEKSAAMKKHLDNSRRIAQSLLLYGEEALELALRSVRAYKNLPPESVPPSEASGLARSALAAAQSGLDAEAHSLGVETVIGLIEAEDG